jgi:hypothetical protein
MYSGFEGYALGSDRNEKFRNCTSEGFIARFATVLTTRCRTGVRPETSIIFLSSGTRPNCSRILPIAPDRKQFLLERVRVRVNDYQLPV